jgi:hypothetical protein
MSSSTAYVRASGTSGNFVSADTMYLKCQSRSCSVRAWKGAGSRSKSLRHQENVTNDLATSPPYVYAVVARMRAW